MRILKAIDEQKAIEAQEHIELLKALAKVRDYIRTDARLFEDDDIIIAATEVADALAERDVIADGKREEWSLDQADDLEIPF